MNLWEFARSFSDNHLVVPAYLILNSLCAQSLNVLKYLTIH